jgi:hypothetical protein
VKLSHLFPFFIVPILVACTGQATPTIYIPAARASTPIVATNTPLASEIDAGVGLSSPQPSPSPDCQSSLQYLEDITIPDGTGVNPQEMLDKRWLVQNSGTCNWDHRFSIRLIAGPDMGAKSEMSLFPARSGNQAEIHIQFTAPREPGVYRSAWQAADPDGNLFGDPIFIEISVLNP